jgi:hypothetical protein
MQADLICEFEGTINIEAEGAHFCIGIEVLQNASVCHVEIKAYAVSRLNQCCGNQ